MLYSAHQAPGQKDLSRCKVLETILRSPKVSRTEVARKVGLNIGSVSRITRDLIEAGLISETDSFGPSDRPGRRFVGLMPQGSGGFVIGIGLNAFRQSVTLADLSNGEVAEWVSPEAPGADGAAFISLCLEKASEMLNDQSVGKDRFFGVGMAVAAEVNAAEGIIINAPVLGWSDAVNVRQLVHEILGCSLVLASPPVAINSTEADIGIGQGVENLTTLHCSLGFGLGVRRGSEDGVSHEFGRVLTQSKVPIGNGRSLSDECGGRAVLLEYYGTEKVSSAASHELGPLLVDLITRSQDDITLRENFRDKGVKAAHCLGLVMDLCQPERLLIAGPLTGSEAFLDGFRATIGDVLYPSGPFPNIQVSDMTPARACRWLALKGCLPAAIENLSSLKLEAVA